LRNIVNDGFSATAIIAPILFFGPEYSDCLQ